MEEAQAVEAANRIEESVEEVTSLLTTTSWQLMDEEQRDDLVRRVIEPRWMTVTSDGTKLGPTWWSKALGTTTDTLQSRVYRLRRNRDGDETPSRAGLTEAQNSSLRSTKSLLRQHPDAAEQLMEDPDIRRVLGAALHHSAADEEATRRGSPGERTRNAVDETTEVAAILAHAQKDIDKVAQLLREGDIAHLMTGEFRDTVSQAVGSVIDRAVNLQRSLRPEAIDDELARILEEGV